MRSLYALNPHRDTRIELLWAGRPGDDLNGAFKLPSPEDGGILKCLATGVGGWDHVSVSRDDRCPTWGEMSHIHREFFRPDEVALQYHVPEAEHVNNHPFCLHLWRPHGSYIPQPPAEWVGVKGVSPEELERRAPEIRAYARRHGLPLALAAQHVLADAPRP